MSKKNTVDTEFAEDMSLDIPESWAVAKIGIFAFAPDGQASKPSQVPSGHDCLIELEDITPNSTSVNYTRRMTWPA